MYFILLLVNIIIGAIQVQTEFIVLTEECRIPHFPAFSEEAIEIFDRQDYKNCTESDLLTFTRVENNTPFLYLDEENEIFHKSEEALTCCYSYVTRNGSDEEPDVGITISECTHFNTSVKLESDVVMVKCEKDSEVIYENVHSPITITEEVAKKLEDGRKTNAHNKPISVLIMVIDSVSRLNFNRTMPKTRKVLLQNGFTDFIAYNKIDDNTFPNFMALLTGMNLKQVYSNCNPYEVGNLDECPMLWYDYQKNGYVTAYAEDWATISTFNYMKKGFQNPPTDYYFKPYVEAAETLNVTEEDGMPYCTGPETEGERILNLAKDFAITFKHQPSFGIFWMNTFSHNNINAPSGMDEKVAYFFDELKRHKILRDSVVILLSDHGIRFGKFRKTIQGWFEERLPLNFISLPRWFEEKYYMKYHNFLDNAKKLTSTYDLYMTLQDILRMSVDDYNISSSPACPHCRSLLSNITGNRSCREAGIPEAWCTCVGEFTTNDPRITEKVNNTAAWLGIREIERVKLEHAMPFSTSITKILFSAVNLNRLRKSYLLAVLETDTGALYQVLFRIRGDPVEFVRVVKIMRLW